ncbi:glycoside hydrolase family 88 protein [Paenibacillus sp. FSL R10-2734]|uniref:glycoside hydrolase family 88/105 protein n=1 Tax=Paenibacillus sp. FSL R10-2734 TaxID=2954691 RepID=UPI0030D9ACFC
MSFLMIQSLKEQYKEQKDGYSVKWAYVEACILKGYLDSYEYFGNEADYQYVKQFVDRMYDVNGDIPGIRLDYYNIDQIRMGSVLFQLYQIEQDLRYKQVLDLLYEQLKVYPRTKSGSFWHKDNYPNQVWLDGLYMGQPFYVQYIKQFEVVKDYSDTIHQFKNARKFLYDDQTHLLKHAYDESREMFWCDKVTGHSPHVWCRAIGWYVMALVDVLELLEGENVDREQLVELLRETIEETVVYQHDDGMWYQVVNMQDKEDNYLESSGTLMLSYAILKGVRLGYLPNRLAVHGEKAFQGTVDRYVYEQDGEVRLAGICKSAGLGRNPDTGIVRDGSYHYYIHGERIVENNGHGVAPLIMAFHEMLLLNKG